MDPTKQTEIWTDIDETTVPDNAAANRQADRCEQASATKNAWLPGIAGSCTSQTANGRLQPRLEPFHQPAKIVRPEAKRSQRCKQGDSDLARAVGHRPTTAADKSHRDATGSQFFWRPFNVGPRTKPANCYADSRFVNHQGRRPTVWF